MTLKIRAIRHGFTLVELLVGMVVLGVITIGMTRLLITQMRFYDKQASAGSARNVSRVSLNRIIADLRMVDADSGVVSAASTDITLRVPYALAISCTRSVISVLPVDSAIYAPEAGGYGWRQSTGYYKLTESGVSVTTNSTSACSDSAVQVLTTDGGRQITLSPALPTEASAKGTIVFLMRRIRYQIKASTMVPGTLGLYRQQVTPSGVAEEEIAAPFAAGSKFRFFVGDVATAVDNPPASLTTIRGFELVLNGQNESQVSGESAKRTENFTTAVFFKNRRL